MKHLKKIANKMKGVTGEQQDSEGQSSESNPTTTPKGYFAVYVGEERQRFVVPTSFLNHPSLKMLLEKASNEFGYDQSDGLVVPCSVSTFQHTVNAIESGSKFHLGKLVDESFL